MVWAHDEVVNLAEYMALKTEMETYLTALELIAEADGAKDNVEDLRDLARKALGDGA